MQNTWKKIAVGVSGAGVIALSGAALSEAQTGGASAPASNSASSNSTSQAQKGGPHGGHGMGHMHGTPVNAATLASLKKVVAAKAPGVTVERAFKAKNGTYHVMGTKAGKRVHVEVNAAMTTATVRQGGPGMHGGPGGRDGHGRHRGVEVTGAKLTSVKNAITAKAPGVTVEKVFQGPKGEFHAMGTKAGKHVMVHVSKDLKTVTVMTGGPGHGGKGGPRGGHGPADWQGAASSSQAA